jgi:predicted aspartyl protease
MFSFKLTLSCQQSDIVPITGVIDTGDAPTLAISLRIFEKIRNDPNVSGAWEEKNLVTLSL